MTVLNKRNAMLGWLTWMVAKRAAKKKAQTMVSGTDGAATGRGVKAVVPLAIAAVGGAFVFRRRHREHADKPE